MDASSPFLYWSSRHSPRAARRSPLTARRSLLSTREEGFLPGTDGFVSAVSNTLLHIKRLDDQSSLQCPHSRRFSPSSSSCSSHLAAVSLAAPRSPPRLLSSLGHERLHGLAQHSLWHSPESRQIDRQSSGAIARVPGEQTDRQTEFWSHSSASPEPSCR